MTEKQDRQRALKFLLTNETTEQEPSLLWQWVETGDQDLLLSFDQEGQMLLDLAESYSEIRVSYQAELDCSKSFHDVAVRERNYERTLCDQYKKEIFLIKEKLHKFENDLENSPSVTRFDKQELLKWIRELL